MLEEIMREFFITIKNDGNVLENFEKIPFDLDPSADIVRQADETVLGLLDSFWMEVGDKDNISWKVFQFKENKYRMVTKSRNWIEF